MNKEFWKDIPGYEGFYQASNLGRVKSMFRKNVHHPRNKFIRTKVLKQTKNSRGYLAVTLCKDNLEKRWNVHHLIALTFLNHSTINSELVIDHIDGVKINNQLKNLQVITQRENSSKYQQNKTSKYTGVSFDFRRNKYQSRIRINKKQVHLGLFDDEKKAHQIYKIAIENIKNYNGNNSEFRNMLIHGL